MNDVSMRPEFVIANVLPGKLNALVKNLMRLTGIEDPVKVVDSINRSEWKLTKVVEAVTVFLKFVGKVSIKVTKPINLDEFFSGRDGLRIDGDFKELFVATDATFTPKEYFLTKYIITKDALDSEARTELPPDHVFEAEDFSLLLATMLYRQWEGTSGYLITNGYANVFYVRSKNKKKIFIVYVFYGSVGWSSVDKTWNVSLWSLNDNWWRAENVFFFP